MTGFNFKLIVYPFVTYLSIYATASPQPTHSPSSADTMTQLELRSWFLEPIPNSASRWTKVRLWGLPISTNGKDLHHSHKWWRSSSIRRRLSPHHLKTRYGTSVRLHGPICKKHASALRMPDHAIRSFTHGFPKRWEQLLVEPIGGPRRSGRLATANEKVDEDIHDAGTASERRTKKNINDNRGTEQGLMSRKSLRSASASRQTRSQSQNSERNPQPVTNTKPLRRTKSSTLKTSKPAKPTKPAVKPSKVVQKRAKPALKVSAKFSEPTEPEQQAKKASRKRVAFADFKQSKPSPPSLPPPFPTPAKLPPPPPPPLAETWSEAQKEAFERQRNTVPADDPDYWTQIAAGVEGKTADECQKLWESSWISPAAKKKKNVDWGKPPKSPKISTPEVMMHVRKAVTRKRSRNTGKYRSGVRRLADTIARETSDDLLEPEIVTPNVVGVSWRDGDDEVPALGTEGTPGSEVRRRKEKVDQDGELATPEILARGKAFGLREADKYVSLFKRRLGACVIPSLKKKEEDSKKKAKNAGSSKPTYIQTTLLPLSKIDSDDESAGSEESDLFF